jgi:uncharacterized protein YndB with AHSA1/START domain
MTTTQIYQVFIKADADQIWQALMDPEMTVQYFHGARVTTTAQRSLGQGPEGETWTDGVVTEFDPPRKLSYEWRSLYDPELAGEPASRVTFEIAPQDGGFCMVTLIHDRLENSPKTAASVSGPGWMMVLSGLKTLLETGKPLVG